MKARKFVAASLVAGLVAATGANAQMAGPGGGMGLARGPYFGGPVDMRAIAVSWLAGLHTSLAITPEQETAWLAFANAVSERAADMQAFRSQIVQPTTATAPQRDRAYAAACWPGGLFGD